MASTTFVEFEENVLARALENYTPRTQQRVLARGVEAIINNGGIGVYQAGCGTGKSIAYGVTVALSGKRTVIATSTKALQEQLANKDMPFLAEHIPGMTYAVLKGRSNYACHQKMAEVEQDGSLDISAVRKALKDDPNHSGDIEHFEIPEMNNQWYKITSSAVDCPGKSECPFGSICYAEKAREAANEAQIVVTNTAMLLTDLKVRAATGDEVRMLGEYELVVLDEAHELPEIATSALSEELKTNQVVRLAQDGMTWITGQEETSKQPDNITVAVEDLWMALEELRGEESNPVQVTHAWIVEHSEKFLTLREALVNLHEEIRSIRVKNGGTDASLRKQRLTRRINNMITKLDRIMTSSEDDLVRWLEVEVRMIRGQREENIVMKASPVDVAPFLREALWETTPSVLVSATLAVGRKFDYITETLGINNALTFDVGTPFDYANQARLFIPPKDAPSPKKGFEWASYAQRTMLQLVTEAGGGALLLFTSRRAMMDAYDALSPALGQQGIRCMKQGDMPNKALAREFAADTDSCLFALKSFFVGVDFAGDACRLVVIDKLPFPVPTDLLFAARSAKIDRKFGSGASFGRLSIPMMTLTLIQGYGRLIRHRNDRGVVAILDSRLSSTGYGKSIVRNLPPAPVVTTTRQVSDFYKLTRTPARAVA